MTALVKSERAELARLEGLIERGMTTFVEVGNALREIRDARLYRASHATFEAYCRERWEWSKAYSNRIIASAAAVEALAPMGVTPTSERQVRPLVNLEPDQQRKVWALAVKTAPEGKVTAKHVESVARKATGRKPKSERPALASGGKGVKGMASESGEPKAIRLSVNRLFRACMEADIHRASGAIERNRAVLDTAALSAHLEQVAVTAARLKAAMEGREWKQSA